MIVVYIPNHVFLGSIHLAGLFCYIDRLMAPLEFIKLSGMKGIPSLAKTDDWDNLDKNMTGALLDKTLYREKMILQEMKRNYVSRPFLFADKVIITKTLELIFIPPFSAKGVFPDQGG